MTKYFFKYEKHAGVHWESCMFRLLHCHFCLVILLKNLFELNLENSEIPSKNMFKRVIIITVSNQADFGMIHFHVLRSVNGFL